MIVYQRPTVEECIRQLCECVEFRAESKEGKLNMCRVAIQFFRYAIGQCQMECNRHPPNTDHRRAIARRINIEEWTNTVRAMTILMQRIERDEPPTIE